MFDGLPIQMVEADPEQSFYDVKFEWPQPQGRLTCFVPYKKPDPIIFKVPLDGSIMRFDQWITRENLDWPFCGVDRTIDPHRLAGTIYPYEELRLVDLQRDLIAYLHREGSKPDIFWVEGDTCFGIQLDTWRWITKNGKRVALICTFPGWNGKLYREPT